jgi:hypothetical protein
MNSAELENLIYKKIFEFNEDPFITFWYNGNIQIDGDLTFEEFEKIYFIWKEYREKPQS